MKKISSPQLTNIGTSLAVALLILVGAFNGLVAPTFNWFVGGVVIAGLVFVLPTIALLRERYPVRQTAWAYFFASHALSFLAAVYIAGLDNPFTTLWVVMLVISYLELGRGAFLMSSLSLISALVVGRQITPEIMPEQRFVLTIVGVVIGLFLTVFAWAIARVALNERSARQDLEKTRAQERIQFHKLDTVMNSLDDTILTLDHSGIVTAQNAAAMLLFNTNSSLTGTAIETLLPLETVGGEKLSYAEVLDGDAKIDRDDILLTAAAGEVMRLEVQLRPVAVGYNGDEIAEKSFVLIARDITKQKTLEQEKDEFISVASHELRTPIAIMEAGLANVLAMRDAGAKPSDVWQFVQDAHEQAIHLGRVVNDLSTAIKVDQQTFAGTLTNLNDILREVCDEFAPKMKQAQLDFQIHLDPHVKEIVTDRSYVKEAAKNLLDNALKYTKTGSVKLESAVSRAGVEIKVADTGVGIARVDHDKIFEKFYRVEDFHTRETGGTGLGLYIVKRLVQKMGGDIGVESRLGQGSTFSIILPKNTKETLDMQ